MNKLLRASWLTVEGDNPGIEWCPEYGDCTIVQVSGALLFVEQDRECPLCVGVEARFPGDSKNTLIMANSEDCCGHDKSVSVYCNEGTVTAIARFNSVNDEPSPPPEYDNTIMLPFGMYLIVELSKDGKIDIKAEPA
ncbi:MAG: hypothetical protein Q8M92_06460, partial [Candidatus Subteraquimicrobiales bacterium]|nr:hypothetical protein [Candidatus Subteraquimicrobiales bacterium]